LSIGLNLQSQSQIAGQSIAWPHDLIWLYTYRRLGRPDS